MKLLISPGKLTYKQLRLILDENTSLELDGLAASKIAAAEAVVREVITNDKIVYGINTGFGSLSNTRISNTDLNVLQKSLVLSHATGTGEPLNDEAVRLILALKINSLARGFSGVRPQTIDALIRLYNAKVYPCIPCKGSVGASGDLAPLAHMSTVLIGVGEVSHKGKILSAAEGLALAGLKPLALGPKEGLSLLNGTQVSTALALQGLFAAENVFMAALATGALTVDVTLGSTQPFDHRIQEVRGHTQQIFVAKMLRDILAGSQINDSHLNCGKVQDPYSLRCQPQVMGAVLMNFLFAKDSLLVEANAVSDNPLVFAEDNEIISGGNFHAEPVAMAADNLAVAIAEIGAISERRLALLNDTQFSSLPPFLVNNAGINSGFMIAQVTAAALASENKCLAYPASVDSLPTSANQEDHVSMATYASRRLATMAENSGTIVAIELLAGCQGIDFRRPLKSSTLLEDVFMLVREQVAFYDKDRYFAPDIAAAKALVMSGKLRQIFGSSLL